MISVMAIVLYVIIAFALGHLMYESIIAPNKRMALRAELLMIQIELHQMDISLIQEMKKRYDTDSKLRERLEKRHRMVLATESAELKSLLNRSQKVIADAFKVNSGAWAMWIIPITMFSTFMVGVQEFASNIITATSKQIRKLIPNPDIDDELLMV